MQLEGENALFSLDFYKAANEAKEATLSEKSLKAPILKISQNFLLAKKLNAAKKSDAASRSDVAKKSDAASRSDVAKKSDAAKKSRVTRKSRAAKKSDAASRSDADEELDADKELENARKMKAYLDQQMEQCTKVDAFFQHSFFDMKILNGLLRYCVDAFVEHDGGLDVKVVAKNTSADSYAVYFLQTNYYT